jgi:hypothetical protein
MLWAAQESTISMPRKNQIRTVILRQKQKQKHSARK